MFISLSSYSQNKLSIITKTGEDVYISSMIDDRHVINYWFKKCMANDLFTFYRVSITSDSTNTQIVNETYSDNIGPFNILEGGWCGGNHLFLDEKTHSRNIFYQIVC